MALAHNPTIFTSNLVLGLDATNTKSYSGSGTVWNDFSGRVNNGTLTSSPTFTSGTNSFFTFNGTTNYVALGNPSSLKPSNITVCAWARSVDINRTSVIFDGNYQGSGQGYLLFLGNDKLGFACRANGSTFASANATNGVLANTWYFMAGTYDGSNVRSYLNGNLEATVAYTSGIAYDSQSIAIGIYQSLINGYSLNGSVGCVLVYNTALTAQQIQQNFVALRGRFGI